MTAANNTSAQSRRIYPDGLRTALDYVDLRGQRIVARKWMQGGATVAVLVTVDGREDSRWLDPSIDPDNRNAFLTATKKATQ